MRKAAPAESEIKKSHELKLFLLYSASRLIKLSADIYLNLTK